MTTDKIAGWRCGVYPDGYVVPWHPEALGNQLGQMADDELAKRFRQFLGKDNMAMQHGWRRLRSAPRWFFRCAVRNETCRAPVPRGEPGERIPGAHGGVSQGVGPAPMQIENFRIDAAHRMLLSRPVERATG